MNDDQKFLLANLKANGPQSSWDWQADHRFALAAGLTEEAEKIRLVLRSHAPTIFRDEVMFSVKHVKTRRLRALQALVKKGLVRSAWVGTGAGGKNEFSVNRCRAYFLVE